MSEWRDEGERPQLAGEELSKKVIAACFEVHKKLGCGFLEKVYENALVIELGRCGLRVRQQCPMVVKYDDQPVGEYFADLLVEDVLLCELKACERLLTEHEVQLVNYLAATGLDAGLLINFGRSVSVKRKFREYVPRRSQGE
jgi:GxxExxY protein